MEEAARRRRFEGIYREHADAVHAYARRRIDSATADDTVAEVFALTWRRLDDVPDAALPWLLACARRVLANQRRGARRLTSLRVRLAASNSPRLPEEGDQLLRTALNQLSGKDREILLLAAWEGLSPSEVASVLGCSPGTAAVRLHRARKRLGAALGRLESDGLRPQAMEALR